MQASPTARASSVLGLGPGVVRISTQLLIALAIGLVVGVAVPFLLSR